MDSAAIADLTRINVHDMLAAFGLQNIRFGRKLFEKASRGAGRRFAHTILAFDRVVGAEGLRAGSRYILDALKMEMSVSGQQHVPAYGPLLILSNHPGLADTVALFAGLPRNDVQIVAAERPFLQHLPAVCRHLIFVPEAEDASRTGVLRSISAHLRSGGTIVTFPAGKIEPDPASMSGARESLESWSESIGFFTRMVSEAQIVPVVISGVLLPQALRHPLTRLRRAPQDRERLAATIQLIMSNFAPQRWPVHIQVRFAPALRAADLAPLRDPAVITRKVIDYTRQILFS